MKRPLIIYLFAVLTSLGFAATSHAESACPSGDGKIVIYSYTLDELLDTTYRHSKKYNQKALEKINNIFRSRSDQKKSPMDIKLIELLDHIQDHFNADSIELISGYRSEELNERLRKNNLRVAENSLHMDAKAADIHIDEVTEEALSNHVASLKCGGIGYYPANDFIHVDVGDVRRWDMPDNPGRLMMGFRKGAIWQISTDRDIYLPNETISYEILNITRGEKNIDNTGRPTLEIFRRGKWRAVNSLPIEKRKFLKGEAWTGKINFSKDDSFGKYRVTLPAPKGFEHLEIRSNEFYRKKL